MSSKSKQVFMIGADWCPYCRKIKPLFQSLSRKHARQIKGQFIPSDTEEARQWTFKSIPTFVFVWNGKKIHQYSDSDPEKLQIAFKAFSEWK